MFVSCFCQVSYVISYIHVVSMSSFGAVPVVVCCVCCVSYVYSFLSFLFTLDNHPKSQLLTKGHNSVTHFEKKNISLYGLSQDVAITSSRFKVFYLHKLVHDHNDYILTRFYQSK